MVLAFIGAFELARAKEAKFEPINSPQDLLEFIKNGQEKGYSPQKKSCSFWASLGSCRPFIDCKTWFLILLRLRPDKNGRDYGRGAKIFIVAQDKNETIKPISENAAFILGGGNDEVKFLPADLNVYYLGSGDDRAEKSMGRTFLYLKRAGDATRSCYLPTSCTPSSIRARSWTTTVAILIDLDRFSCLART